MRGAVSGIGDQLRVVQQGAFSRSEPGFIELPFQNRINTLIVGPLNTQEVSVAVQSIRAPVQEGDVTGKHFFVAAGEMALREVDRV